MRPPSAKGMHRLKTLFVSLLGHRRLPVVLALLAVLLVLPSAWTGLQLDDFYHWSFLTGNTTADGRSIGANDLFNFLDGDARRLEALMDAGAVPWWTSKDLRIAFWRPLSGLTHRLDYLLWPDRPWLMHAQSFLWFAMIVVVATLLYRRLNAGLFAAGLAAVFFAIDDAHGFPVGWIANRNALIAGFFGLAALLAHVRWRTDGWRAGAVLGPLSWTAALLSGEIAMGAGAFLFAWAVCLDRAPTRSRIVSLTPYALVFVAWIVWHSLEGYGASGSGFYVDPVHEPLRFLVAVAEKAPVLLTDQFGFPPSSISIFLYGAVKSAIWSWSIVFLGVLALAFAPMIARDATARFWTIGTLLSVPLICTTVPNSRLLLFTGFGGMGLLGIWFERHISGTAGEQATRSGGETGAQTGGSAVMRISRPLYICFIIVHGILAPVMMPLTSLGAATSRKFIQDPISRMKLSDAVDGKTLVLVNAPVFLYAQLTPTVLRYQGRPAPRTLRVLAPGEGAVHVNRVSATELLIRMEFGWFRTPFDNVFRDVETPMNVGETIDMEGMTVEIRETTPDGRPLEALFRFTVPLEDGSLEWMKWETGDYLPFSPPPVGSTETLSGPSPF